MVTSGGVGPTHDDRTVSAIARAFGVGIERHPDLVEMIRAWWEERFTEAALRMAEIPAGSRLVYSNDGLIPMVVFRNVYIFPGIPRSSLQRSPPFEASLKVRPRHLASLYLNSDESAIADRMTAVDSACPEVKIGSYPRSEGEDHRVWITFESTDATAANSALDQLLEVLEEAEIVRVERI